MALEESAVVAPLAPGAVEALRAMIRGEVIAPDDAAYATARQAWNLRVQQYPSVIVTAADVDDVVAAVRFAGTHDLPIAVMRTGHGIVAACDGGLLLLTENLQGVTVDPERRVARLAAGALWGDVMVKSLPHGLIPLVGSSPYVGAVGYSLGGGIGWLTRKYGLAADSVRALDIVTADGQPRHVTPASEPDLFWAARGGGGNFGVITSLECQLYPVGEVYGGNLFYPMESVADALAAYSRWAPTLPEEFSSGFLMMRFPEIPDIPPPLRGKNLCMARGCYVGAMADGEELLRPMRQAAPVAIDMFGPMPIGEVEKISNDPIDPLSVCSWTETLRDLGPETRRTLAQLKDAVPDSPFFSLEVRHIGNSAAIQTPQASAFSLRDAEYVLIVHVLVLAPEQESVIRGELAELAAALKPHATGQMYFNFVTDTDVTPERTRATHTPEHNQRLATIKARYDPENMFRFNVNITPAEPTVTH